MEPGYDALFEVAESITKFISLGDDSAFFWPGRSVLTTPLGLSDRRLFMASRLRDQDTPMWTLGDYLAHVTLTSGRKLTIRKSYMMTRIFSYGPEPASKSSAFSHFPSKC